MAQTQDKDRRKRGRDQPPEPRGVGQQTPHSQREPTWGHNDVTHHLNSTGEDGGLDHGVIADVDVIENDGVGELDGGGAIGSAGTNQGTLHLKDQRTEDQPTPLGGRRNPFFEV